jgi:NADPH-dependent curcumin reductase CurA
VLKYGADKFLYLINNGLAAFAGVSFIKEKAKPTDTVVVSTAAGATGLLVCHLLLKTGIKVIALTSQKKM